MIILFSALKTHCDAHNLNPDIHMLHERFDLTDLFDEEFYISTLDAVEAYQKSETNYAKFGTTWLKRFTKQNGYIMRRVRGAKKHTVATERVALLNFDVNFYFMILGGFIDPHFCFNYDENGVNVFKRSGFMYTKRGHSVSGPGSSDEKHRSTATIGVSSNNTQTTPVFTFKSLSRKKRKSGEIAMVNANKDPNKSWIKIIETFNYDDEKSPENLYDGDLPLATRVLSRLAMLRSIAHLSIEEMCDAQLFRTTLFGNASAQLQSCSDDTSAPLLSTM